MKWTQPQAHILWAPESHSRLFLLFAPLSGTAEPGGLQGAHFFPNVMLKQLRFKTLVVQFPREAYKMLYFYLKPPPPLVIPLRRPCLFQNLVKPVSNWVHVPT